MPIVAALFWVLGLILSITIAPQLRIWTWGPTLLCFVISTACILPSYWRKKNTCPDVTVFVTGFFLAAWIAYRAFTTPVVESAQSDGLLLAMALSTFLCFRPITSHYIANKLLIFGLAAALLASILVIVLQISDPLYSPFFPNKEKRFPAGFFAHYSYGASFLIPTSLVLAAIALYSGKNLILRIILLVIAFAGCVAVYFTNSRGGYLALGVGVGVLLTLGTFASRKNKIAFGIHLLAFPLLIGLAAFFYNGLLNIQEQRGGGEFSGFVDNSTRLFLLSIAYSCITIHPWIGGGSRSYSWECFQFWDSNAMSVARAKPEHVHNEFVQTACDYGLLGLLLLIIFMIVVFISSLILLVSSGDPKKQNTKHYWIVGGIAGFIGLFVQSNFEGILRLPTGAIMLGLTLAAASLTPFRDLPRSITTVLPRILATFVIIISIVIMAKFGWQGTLVTKSLWPSYFGKTPISSESKLVALDASIAVWPLGSLYQDRALTHNMIAFEKQDRSQKFKAIDDYELAVSLHPYHPEPAFNLAVLLSEMGENERAEKYFTRAVDYQGRMEVLFRANSEFAYHLLKKASKQAHAGEQIDSLKTLELANKHVNLMAESLEPHFRFTKETKLFLFVRESYARALAQTGELAKALEIYNENSKHAWGNSSNYYAGLILSQIAAEKMELDRNNDALAFYIQALERVNMITSPPEGITEPEKAKNQEYLKKMINYLREAKFTPSENPEI